MDHNENMRRRGLAGHRYLFSHTKYEARSVPTTGTCQFIKQKYEGQCVPESWSAGTCFPTQNVKRGMYLQRVAVYQTRIWAEHILEDRNEVGAAAGVSGRLQVPVFAFPLVKS